MVLDLVNSLLAEKTDAYPLLQEQALSANLALQEALEAAEQEGGVQESGAIQLAILEAELFEAAALEAAALEEDYYQ
jgi:hypothetical protein